MLSSRISAPLILLALVLGLTATAHAATVNADPSNYQSVIGTLSPGDTMVLAAGNYPNGLSVSNLNGTDSAWIVIKGPTSGSPAVFLGDPGQSRNTVEITNSSYVAIESLTIDGQDVPGVFGISAKGGSANRVHHIRIEGCTIVGHSGGGTSQQTVGISTKCPTWNWTIRGNHITAAGTGMYLGNSNGDEPFVAGIIEGNLIENCLGYCLQVKHQNPRPAIAGMPTGESRTVIRNNVFIKNDDPSPSGDRPNVLTGTFPQSGAGASDLYEIYGNLFFYNPRENLLQSTGRVTIHDNIFVSAAFSAIRLTDHNGPLDVAYVYNNTIYQADRGIHFANAAATDHAVIGNLVFATQPITGSVTTLADNVTDAVANAGAYVTTPSTTLGVMDFYPLTGQCQGTALNLSAFAGHTDYDVDFNGDSKGTFTFRGAYAGEGTNPGWTLGATIKTGGGSSPPSGGGGPGGTPGAGGCNAMAPARDGASARGIALAILVVLTACGVLARFSNRSPRHPSRWRQRTRASQSGGTQRRKEEK